MGQVKCIMLVDDNKIDNLLAQKIIEINEISDEVITAKHGLVALIVLDNYFKTYGRNPDVILIDLQMPIMNGFELIEKLNSKSIKSKLIVLTASLDDEIDKARLKELGVTDWLLKPLEWNELLKILK